MEAFKINHDTKTVTLYEESLGATARRRLKNGFSYTHITFNDLQRQTKKMLDIHIEAGCKIVFEYSGKTHLLLYNK